MKCHDRRAIRAGQQHGETIRVDQRQKQIGPCRKKPVSLTGLGFLFMDTANMRAMDLCLDRTIIPVRSHKFRRRVCPVAKTMEDIRDF